MTFAHPRATWLRAFGVGLFAVIVGLSPAVARAQEMTADEKAFVLSHVSQFVKVEPTKLVDPVLPRVFAVPLYTLTISVIANGSMGIQKVIVARLGGDLVGVSYPSEDDSAPQIVKMLSTAFRLRTDQDATVLQRALDVAYPNGSEDDKKTATFHHAGNQWQFVRGHFFGSATGFIFTTDGTGAITSAKYMLKMP
jgi:hypothetical protein